MATIIDGTPGDDVLIGTSADEIINGYAGNDLLRGNGGVDSFDGGSDTGDNPATGYGDRVSFYQLGATQGVVADLRTGIISNDGFGNAETMVGIESLGADTAFVDTFDGNDGINFLAGGRGDNLYGFGGDDFVLLSVAAAVVDGGSGADTLALISTGGWLMPDSDNDGFAETAPAATAGWFVNLAAGTMTDGYGNSGTVVGIENVDGSALDDVLIGDQTANVLRGLAGNDLLRGNAGVDSFDGGSDTGDNPGTGYGDRVSFYEFRATQGVVADLRTGIISNDGFGNVETMVGIEALGADTAFVDTFYGSNSRNQLYGNRGDNLYGFGGNDDVGLSSAASVVDGGSGIDLLALDSSGGWLMPDSDNDGVAEVAAAATVGWTVDLASRTMTDGYGNNGTVTGIENVDGSELSDSITGDANANDLRGNDGNDTLVGGRGDDFLYGGLGNDALTGSQGRDTFVIEASSGDDTIRDFSRSGDTILFDVSSGVTSFSQLVFTQVGGDTSVTWGTSDSLLIQGVKPKQFSASDFQFGASFAAGVESLVPSDFSHGTFGGGSVHHLPILVPEYLF